MGAGYWLNPDTGKCVQVRTTHDEWVRDKENARSIGVPQWVYDEIMRYPPTAVDEIRLLALHCGLVRMREHPRYLSIQFAAERLHVAQVLPAIAAALNELPIHADTIIRMDNLRLNESVSITVAELKNRLESQQPLFSESNDQGNDALKGHPFLMDIRQRFAQHAPRGTAMPSRMDK